jgi:diphthamide synthase (EF-2-diphthine--ammonia ligase)
VREFLATGFRAVIVVVDTNQMPIQFLGREIDESLVGELEAIGVDACGERQEIGTGRLGKEQKTGDLEIKNDLDRPCEKSQRSALKITASPIWLEGEA